MRHSIRSMVLALFLTTAALTFVAAPAAADDGKTVHVDASGFYECVGTNGGDVTVGAGPAAVTATVCYPYTGPGPASAGRDVTVDTTRYAPCVGPWMMETGASVGPVSATVITCDPFIGSGPTSADDPRDVVFPIVVNDGSVNCYYDKDLNGFCYIQ